jgi:adenosylhomocysteine nucleosidase
MICFVIAYKAEAASLISHYRLELQQQQEFPLYSAEDIALVICGSGKSNAAAATAYLHGKTGFHRDAIWINFGIAGHAVDAPGSVYVASKVIDVATERVLHLALPDKPPWKTAALYTYDQPHRGGQRDKGVFDMEASGFAFTARRFSQSQFVHCIKLITDNCNTSIEIPASATFEQWMMPQMHPLDSFLHALLQV